MRAERMASLALCLFLVPAARAADGAPALDAAAALYDGIRAETLPNGLRVYLKPIPSAPTVTTKVAYKVGSADENLDATGLSHYLEHLMFKGTAALKPGDIDRLTLRNGGANNANTSEDMTVYHFDFAADKWPIALQIEADRMRGLRVDAAHEFEQEKGAVVNELRRNEDEPWDLEQKAILPLLFGKDAPYGHPVIGERAHVHAATAEVIKAHYDRWYHPNNAALVVVGGFDPDAAMTLIRKHFGGIPSTSLPERKTLPRETPKRPARLEMPSKFDAPRLLVGFPTVRITDPDNPALEIIETLLSGGRTGRLYKKLVEGDEVATSVSASNNTGRYPGWFSLQVELLPSADRTAVEKTVLSELQRLAKEGPSDAELKRARRVAVAEAVFGRESVHDLADAIARGVTFADLDWLKQSLPRLVAVTAADVQRVVARYLDPESRVVVWSVPAKKGGAAGSGGAADRPRRRAAAAAPGSFSLKDTQRVVLPNGLTLLLRPDRRLPIFVAQALVRGVALHEPEDKAGVATLAGSLLQEGTENHSGAKIAELIEDVGGSLTMSGSGGGVKVLASDRRLGLGLLLECLTRPTFPKEAFAREKQRLLTTIDYSAQEPNARGAALYRELAYGSHPFGRSLLTRRSAVEALTRDDCAAFHKRVVVPGNTLVALTGDFEVKTVVDEVTALTEKWEKADLPRAKTPEVEKPKVFTRKVLSLPKAEQLHLYFGHVGIRRSNPDYFKLLVMDYVLGTGPGFTDRLSARLRDRQGLAYTVSATITGSAGEEPSLFTCYVGTDPENFEKVRSQLLEEIVRLREETPADKEVDDAKLYLTSNLPFRFATNEDVAAQLLYVERNGLGFDYVADYTRGVAAVTAADVRAVAKTYLDPERLVFVAAGPVDDQGKVLAK